MAGPRTNRMRTGTARAEGRPVRAGGRGVGAFDDGGPDRIRTGDLQRDRLACWAATPRVQLRRGRRIAEELTLVVGPIERPDPLRPSAIDDERRASVAELAEPDEHPPCGRLVDRQRCLPRRELAISLDAGHARGCYEAVRESRHGGVIRGRGPAIDETKRRPIDDENAPTRLSTGILAALRIESDAKQVVADRAAGHRAIAAQLHR